MVAQLNVVVLYVVLVVVYVLLYVVGDVFSGVEHGELDDKLPHKCMCMSSCHHMALFGYIIVG